jgi:antitoxin ParD1/3/4
MKIVTINLPEPFLAALEKLTDYGLYPSRSEAIRVALRDFLSKELQIAQKLKEVHEEMKDEKAEEKKLVATAF